MPESTKNNQRMDYSRVTEVPGVRTTREAESMLYTRYSFAAQFCQDKQVLEVGGGAGIGLGYLARHASSVVGSDYTETMLQCAQKHYRGRVSLVQLDAHNLPFRDASFDVVILFEAIYYLARPQAFLEDCRRVLRDGGALLICSANKEWPSFNPSPLSKQYFSARELYALLAANGFDVEVFGGFHSSSDGAGRKAVEAIRLLAVRLHLIPRTLRGRELLKRLFYGRLVTISEELTEGTATQEPILPLPADQPVPHYKILYAVGRVPTGVPSPSEATRAISTLA